MFCFIDQIKFPNALSAEEIPKKFQMQTKYLLLRKCSQIGAIYLYDHRLVQSFPNDLGAQPPYPLDASLQQWQVSITRTLRLLHRFSFAWCKRIILGTLQIPQLPTCSFSLTSTLISIVPVAFFQISYMALRAIFESASMKSFVDIDSILSVDHLLYSFPGLIHHCCSFALCNPNQLSQLLLQYNCVVHLWCLF